MFTLLTWHHMMRGLGMAVTALFLVAVLGSIAFLLGAALIHCMRSGAVARLLETFLTRLFLVVMLLVTVLSLGVCIMTGHAIAFLGGVAVTLLALFAAVVNYHAPTSWHDVRDEPESGL